MSESEYFPPLRDDEIRARLLDVPEFGRVTRYRGKIVLDFSPSIRGSGRYLFSFAGKAFADEAEAEAVRVRICGAAATEPLEDAIARYRGTRSRSHTFLSVVDRFLDEANETQSDQTGRFRTEGTLHTYAGVLRRARPFFEGMTTAEALDARTLRKFKAWFRIPKPNGRGLKSDQEARNTFAALRSVVAWYRIENPKLPNPNWPPMPTAIKAKQESDAPQNENRLTLAEVVRGIDCVAPERSPLFWVLFYTQARPSEVRAILGCDYARPRLTIRRGASNKSASAEVRPFGKNHVKGSYDLPDWVCDLIDRHCTGARFDRNAPLFPNPDPRVDGGIYSDDLIRREWARASKRAGLPWVSVYRAFKHTQVTALRSAGISIEDIVAQCRWTSESMLEHYDEEIDERRTGVVSRLDELVSKSRGNK